MSRKEYEGVVVGGEGGGGGGGGGVEDDKEVGGKLEVSWGTLQSAGSVPAFSTFQKRSPLSRLLMK